MTEADIDCLSIGAGILGTGGGGSPYVASIVCKNLIKSGKKLRIISHDNMKETDFTYCGAFLGVFFIFC